MSFGAPRVFIGATFIAITCLAAAVRAAGQSGTAQNPPDRVPMSEEAFKNIQVLKGIPVDTFFDTMGMFANSLGNDCTYCHSPKAYFDKAAFAEQTPLMNRARGMILMMQTINKNYFKGEPRVTCFTCHGGSESPKAEPNIMLQYGVPPDDPNVRSFFPDTSFTADQVFDKYVTALGGADRLAKLTSFAAKGTYAGFDTARNKIPVEIYGRLQGQSPQQNTVIHMFNGDSIRTFDGQNGWIAGPDTPLPLVQLTSGNLERAQLEAMAPFGTMLRKTFSEWRTARASVNDKEVRVLQGVRDGQVVANFYFDEAGYLVRLIRWNKTPVTWVPTHIDLADYRDLPGTGVKFPFRKVITQTYQQTTIELSEVRPNVDVPASRFDKPKPGR
jgi:photosynthetic reaction center cytochrome c subunit